MFSESPSRYPEHTGVQAQTGTLTGQVLGLLGFSLLFTAGGAILAPRLGPGAFWASLIGSFGCLIALWFLNGTLLIRDRQRRNGPIPIVEPRRVSVGRGWGISAHAGCSISQSTEINKVPVMERCGIGRGGDRQGSAACYTQPPGRPIWPCCRQSCPPSSTRCSPT